MKDLEQAAAILDDAARTASAVPQFEGDASLSVAEAYAVQALSLARRRQRGEQLVGVKMGLTSRAKMQQVGVDEVIWGQLTDAMRLEEGGFLSMQRYVHPRVEPEIAFLLKKPLYGQVSALEALSAVEAVAPALEVIDSRYQNFKFALGDVIADNSSSSGFFVGSWHSPASDIGNLGIVLEANGQPVQIGSSAAILGHPLRSLAAAAQMLGQVGMRLEAGWIVLAGAATAAHPLAEGMHIRSTTQGLGSVSFQVRA